MPYYEDLYANYFETQTKKGLNIAFLNKLEIKKVSNPVLILYLLYFQSS